MRAPASDAPSSAMRTAARLVDCLAREPPSATIVIAMGSPCGMRTIDRIRRPSFRELVVRIAIQPTLTPLCGCDDGMSGRVGVLPGVAVRGVVATQRRSALLARSQMDPRSASFHALRVFTSLWGLDGRDRIEVCAVSVAHHPLLTPASRDGRPRRERVFADRQGHTFLI